MKVGFVGIGHMGGGIARRLLSQGVAVAAYDPSEAACDRLRQQGGRIPGSLETLAREVEVLFLCLPNGESQAATVAALERSPGTVRYVLDCSTLGPAAVMAMATALQSRGVAVIDCPVSGGAIAAAAGTLALICSGAPDDVAAVQPVLAKISSQIFVVGDAVGMAQVCKLANNAIAAAGMIAACEALIVGRKAGLPVGPMFDAINAGSGRNNATSLKIPKHVLTGTYDFGGPASLMVKDLDLFIQQAQEHGVSAEMARAARALWQASVAQIGNTADYTEIIKYFDGKAGLPSFAKESS